MNATKSTIALALLTAGLVGLGPLAAPACAGLILADSKADFPVELDDSAAKQGVNNWYYGWTDLHAYATIWIPPSEPTGFFLELPYMTPGNPKTDWHAMEENDGPGRNSTDHWGTLPGSYNGDTIGWLFTDGPNGTEAMITKTTMTPAAQSPAPEEDPANDSTYAYFPVRRWESEIEGTVRVSGYFENLLSAGNGTELRIYVDGEKVWSAVSVGGTIGANKNFDLVLPVQLGSNLDFLLAAGEANGFPNAAGDLSEFHAVITLVPEPAGFTLAAFGLLGMIGCVWRFKNK